MFGSVVHVVVVARSPCCLGVVKVVADWYAVWASSFAANGVAEFFLWVHCG